MELKNKNILFFVNVESTNQEFLKMVWVSLGLDKNRLLVRGLVSKENVVLYRKGGGKEYIMKQSQFGVSQLRLILFTNVWFIS